jgi:hypothetical protein
MILLMFLPSARPRRFRETLINEKGSSKADSQAQCIAPSHAPLGTCIARVRPFPAPDFDIVLHFSDALSTLLLLQPIRHLRRQGLGLIVLVVDRLSKLPYASWKGLVGSFRLGTGQSRAEQGRAGPGRAGPGRAGEAQTASGPCSGSLKPTP